MQILIHFEASAIVLEGRSLTLRCLRTEHAFGASEPQELSITSWTKRRPRNSLKIYEVKFVTLPEIGIQKSLETVCFCDSPLEFLRGRNLYAMIEAISMTQLPS